MKAFRYMLVVTGLGVLGALVAIRSGGQLETTAPEAVAVVPEVSSKPEPAPAPRPEAPTVAMQVPSALALAESIPGEEGEHGEFTTSTDLVKQQIFKTEPKLALVDRFRQHVLLDAQGRGKYQALLADKEMYEQTRQALLHPTDAMDSLEFNTRRLMQIDYLRMALSWRENPERRHLLSVVEGIILEDSFGPMMPPDVKRSVAATKMELYEILYDQEPEKARSLVEAARRTRLKGMLEYIAARNERRVAKERALSLQTQRTP